MTPTQIEMRKVKRIFKLYSTGLGKSYLASAIGHQACSKGFKVMCFKANKLFAMLKTSKIDGSYVKQINRLGRRDLLILMTLD